MADVGATQDGKAVIDPAIAAKLAEFDATKPIGTFTVATLPEPDASNLYRVARVSDLFGETQGVVRCLSVGTLFYWRPESSDSAKAVPLVGNLDVLPLGHSQGLRFTGAIGVGVTRNVTLLTDKGWPGCTKEMSAAGLGSILGTLNVLGTGLGTGVGLATGSYKKFMLDYSGGALSWIQLV